MEKLTLSILILHITAATIALLSGLLAILFRNKLKIHRPVGKIYFWAMTVVCSTAVYLSVIKLNIFLFCVSFFTYYACLTAYRSLKLKKLHLGQKPTWFDWSIELFFGVMHIGFLGFAAFLLISGNTSFGIISLAFGFLGIRGNYITIKRFTGQQEYRNYWLLAHISGMSGSYIGALTAFLVNNNKWIHAPQVLVWLGPTVFIIPLVVFEMKKHRQKAGKFAMSENVISS
ncbi:MAG: hypothetical protein JWO32_664 [Bacteroidetes bacterium]|nr:hypothetical protein [Bacteroidota bacterium]